ncbi:hypothetical protein Goari_024232 [Gossypium aridum]|uniref:RNase H type-1 domain-containing protein n=1 Tax=Gossypium aridum TaxID=34290 RepID=A0A7J8X5F4_GOSAI|nr:hypothetical protein [Gossypium aridum]
MGRCSFLWRSLSNVWPLASENFLWPVGDGKLINCWRDPWISNYGHLLEAGLNKIIWVGSSNGSFSIKTAYWRIRWILGYKQFVGICSILDAELLGILEGLAIAIDRGFDRVFILSDSQKAVQVVQESATRVMNSVLVKRTTYCWIIWCNGRFNMSPEIITKRLIV